MNTCLIIGAGLAGLAAAHVLQKHGVQTTLLDKGRGVGGRMATRRLEHNGQTAHFDHGAQFFTARSAEFQNAVQQWQQQHIAREWYRGQNKVLDGTLQTQNDGYPRFCARPGMTAIAKQVAQNLDIRLSSRVTALHFNGEQWTAQCDNGSILSADYLILTPPVPQSLALLDLSEVRLPSQTRTELEAMQYDPCIAAMLLLENNGQVPAPGALYFDGEPISWIGDNFQKGVSRVPGSITIHAAPQWSRDHWETPEEDVIKVLYEAAAPFLGAAAQAWSVHRWRYAKPIDPRTDGCVCLNESRLIFAGDAFGGAKVEGAFLSGLAAARAVIKVL